MKKILSILCCFALLAGMFVFANVHTIAQSSIVDSTFEGVDFVVSVDANKDPVVLQLTDPQIVDSSQNTTSLSSGQIEWYKPENMQKNCFDYIIETVETTKPDLILLTGDLVYGNYDHDGSALLALIEVMESLKVPWAPIFGNHDIESKMGADWQCAQLEAAQYCLFKQRTLSGNGNYTVGIEQGGVLKRVFFMMDSNGCGGMSSQSSANGHSKGGVGFYSDQISWYKETANTIKTNNTNVKISFAFHIQPSAFSKAFDKYGIASLSEPVLIDKHENKEQGDFGIIAANLKSAWDGDNSVWNSFKQIGVDSVFVGHEHKNSGSVMYDGIRCQYGQKSSTYDRFNYVTALGALDSGYPPITNATPLIGGTVSVLDKTDASFKDAYIYLCEEAGGKIDWDSFGEEIETATESVVLDFNGSDFSTESNFDPNGINASKYTSTKLEDTSSVPSGFTGGVYKGTNCGSDGYATVRINFNEPIDVSAVGAIKIRMYVTNYTNTSGKSTLIRIFQNQTYNSMVVNADFNGKGGKYGEWVEIDILPMISSTSLIQNNELNELYFSIRFYTADTTATCYYDSIILDYSHIIDQEVVDEKYKASDATCTKKATYYKSCECGFKGTATFEVGDYGDHVFNKEVATDKYKVEALSNADKTTYYKSCECGQKGTETFVVNNSDIELTTQTVVYDFNGVDFDTTSEMRSDGINAPQYTSTLLTDTSSVPNGFTGGVYKNTNCGSDGYASFKVKFNESINIEELQSLKIRMYLTSYTPTSGKSPLIRVFTWESYSTMVVNVDYKSNGGKFNEWVEIDILPLIIDTAVVADGQISEFYFGLRYYTADTTATCYYDSFIAEYLRKAPVEDDNIVGDFNGDNVIDDVDYQYIADVYTGKVKVENKEEVCDINCDGKFDIRDIIAVKELIQKI